MAATVLDQMSFSECMRHKASVIEVQAFQQLHCVLLGLLSAQVASTAMVEQRGPVLGVLYDEYIRRDWEDRQAKVPSFKPGESAGMLPPSLSGALPCLLARIKANSMRMCCAELGSSMTSYSPGRHLQGRLPRQPELGASPHRLWQRAVERLRPLIHLVSHRPPPRRSAAQRCTPCCHCLCIRSCRQRAMAKAALVAGVIQTACGASTAMASATLRRTAPSLREMPERSSCCCVLVAPVVHSLFRTSGLHRMSLAHLLGIKKGRTADAL